ncbi:hypothetical protein RF11_11905 [Thelohanellus kitauei]|uniref:Uncharacterized protein n=1 Tax=Thelohanellus kitauei TaxID=669202 RepID=A0A0C2MZG3_THEKT|nr:hypothetical protein RF11_11905 [Thelohanellus kitauei]
MNEIKFILKKMIYILSDITYINKHHKDPILFLYEDFKSNYLSVIHDDLLNTVFTGCQSYIHMRFNTEYDKDYKKDEYELYRNIMTMIIGSFNENAYLDSEQADHYLRLCDGNTSHSSPNESIEFIIDDHIKACVEIDVINH